MSEHPSDHLLVSYERNELRGRPLLQVDDHIAACPACAARVSASPSRAARAFRASLAGEHVAFDRVEAYVDGHLDSAGRQEMDVHLSVCRTCADELTDLRLFRGRDRSPRASWIGIGAAAAAILAIAIGTLLWPTRMPERPTSAVSTAGPSPTTIPLPRPVIRDAGTTFAIGPDGTVSGLSPGDAETLTQLRAGVLTGAAIFADVHAGKDVLRGDERPADELQVTAPRGFVLEDRPAFRWSDRASGAIYRVGLFDRAYRVVARSGAITTREWRPERALRRGEVYEWQVTRRRGGETTSAPAPPAPAARFRVVSARGLDDIRKAEQARSHLLMVLAYTREGMLDDARREIDRLSVLNPQSTVVMDVRTTLERHHSLLTSTNADQ